MAERQPQRQTGMPLKVARISPLASKVVRTRYSRGSVLSGNSTIRVKCSRGRGENLPVARKLPPGNACLDPIFPLGEFQRSRAAFHAGSCVIVLYGSVLPVTEKSETRTSAVVVILTVRRNRDRKNRSLKIAL